MDRKGYVGHLVTLAKPVLEAASRGKLREIMTVEQKEERDRKPYACLEAVGRLLCGMAPWFEAEITDPAEKELRDAMAEQARLAIAHQVDPSSPDRADFANLKQPNCQLLVDGAFLAEAQLRAPEALLHKLPEDVMKNLITAYRHLRDIQPPMNNWILFSAEVEILLNKLTGEFVEEKIHFAYNSFEKWYCGDGWYGDGPHFATDFYNSLVIHPMLIDLCRNFGHLLPDGALGKEMARALRYAQVLERMIAADGTFISVGRSNAYRCGVFHLLAMLAMERNLPESLSPSGVREGLGAVIARTLAPASYREDGFLKIGLCGEQPGLGETYINTGSLYLAATAFLPLGLPEKDPFWSEPEKAWTQKSIWSGEDSPADHAIH